MRSIHWVLVGLFGTWLSACGGNDNSGYVRPKGRGSAACQAWQKSFCDFAAVECGKVSEIDCVESYYSITCNSDEKAQSCATALDNATCATGLPTGCNIMDLADPQPAVDACNALVDATCQRASECGGGTVDQCDAEIRSDLDCTSAIGYTASFDSCLDELPKLSCSASDLPNSCKDVIRIQ